MKKLFIILEKLYKVYSLSIGKYGGLHVKDTAEHIGEWYWFQVQEDCIISTITVEGAEVTEMASVAYPQGFVYYGAPITSITLQEGHIKLFKSDIVYP